MPLFTDKIVFHLVFPLFLVQWILQLDRPICEHTSEKKTNKNVNYERMLNEFCNKKIVLLDKVPERE